VYGPNGAPVDGVYDTAALPQPQGLSLAQDSGGSAVRKPGVGRRWERRRIVMRAVGSSQWGGSRSGSRHVALVRNVSKALIGWY